MSQGIKEISMHEINNIKFHQAIKNILQEDGALILTDVVDPKALYDHANKIKQTIDLIGVHIAEAGIDLDSITLHDAAKGEK